jgi:subtilisin family serine protease
LKTGLVFKSGAIAALAIATISAQTRHVNAPGNLPSYIYTGPVSKVSPPTSYKSAKSGPVRVAIKLSDPPLVVEVGTNAKQNGITMTAAQQRAYIAQLAAKQNVIAAQITSLGGTVLARVTKAHNAVIATIDVSHLPTLKALSGVVAVRPVADFALTSSDVSIPYVGASAVQANGVTGQGIRVAMLDTGVDYTHYNLGGSGKVADYHAATAVAGGTPPANLFPSAKVIGGFDFVGDTWDGTATSPPLAPDPNPIDLNGHGTRTSDIVGGHSLDGLHVGVAPGTQLYAVKVCSSVASACSGVAILEGLEFALDPNNTGTLSDAVDVISMSIGGDFGQREEDDGEAFTDIVNFGVVSVVAAGNSGDIPYVVGGPSSTPEVISVAATTAPDSFVIPLVINSPASIAGTYPNTATVSFAPITGPLTGNVVYVGGGCPGSTLLANPTGAIALVDRGTCNVSLKVDNVANAGAIGVLVGLVAPGDAVSFSSGGGSNFPPTLVITQSTSNLIKTALGSSPVSVTLSPTDAISTAGNIASYSSRGPNYSYNALKPDMSAPGTVVAAVAGTGNQQSSEDGTSFATPLTSGSAALLLSQNHTLGPLDIKALLMETTNTTVYNNVATQPGVLAPMSRMGSGELRVNLAAAASTAVWDASDPLAVSLSFGTYRLNAGATYKKKVVVRNYSASARTYTITNTYRDAPNTNGVTITAPASVPVPANGSASFNMSLTVVPANLPVWTLNGGSNGASGELLNTVEYAGYLTFASGTETVHIPWHILPHKAANVTPATTSVALNGNLTNLTLFNSNATVGGAVGVFSLTGTGTQFPASILPAPGSDYALINLQAVGVRVVCADQACDTFAAQFAVNTFGQRSHPDYPAEFDVLIDVNNDGIPDLDVFNTDIGFITTGANSGQNGVFVVDLAANTASGPYFYTIADLDSADAILTIPLSALTTASGLSLGVSTPFTFTVDAFDNFYTGNLTDQIGPMQYELDMPKFYAFDLTVPPNSSAPLTIVPNNAANFYLTGPYNGNSPSQTGLLLMYQDGLAGVEAAQILVTP